MDQEGKEEVFRTLTDWIAESAHTVVLTGPALSLEAGIPGLMGGASLYDSCRDLNILSMDNFLKKPGWAWELLSELKIRVERAPIPPVYHTLAVMEQSGDIDGIITMNVDGLHQRAGNRNIVEIMGSLHDTTCLDCRSIVTDNRNNPDACPPTCRCGGLIKPTMLFQGETIATETWSDAMALIERCQLLLCIGVSGRSMPVSHLACSVAAGGGRVVEITPGVTSFPTLTIALHLPLPFHETHRLLTTAA